MAMADECCSPPLKERRFRSSLCCFRINDPFPHHDFLDHDYSRPQTPRSPYTWLKLTAHELEIMDRCRSLIGRISRHRKRHSSADFKYDPLSYALNFEDDNRLDEVPFSNFSSRLPMTPERLSKADRVVDATPRRGLVAAYN